MLKKIEIACFNLESAIIAEKSGADRIELCENYKEGGLSPDENLMKEVLRKTDIPVFVMIRPRTGNFFYTEKEIEIMKQQILNCKKHNCDGVVFGVLNPDNTINVEACKALVQLAQPLPCTFHRAFDETKNKELTLEQIISCGFKRILTSGGAATALEGKENLKQFVELANGRITIIPGGGIRSSNIKNISEATGALEFHSAAILENDTANANEIHLICQQLN